MLHALLVTGLLVGAPEPQLDEEQLREASAIFDETWSPFCPGRTLSSCTSGQAMKWREDVRSWLAQGESRQAILDKLQARVPDFTLETVPDTGGTRYGPIALGGVFAVALVGLAWQHGRRREGAEAPAAPDTSAGNPDAERLARELEDLDP